MATETPSPLLSTSRPTRAQSHAWRSRRARSEPWQERRSSYRERKIVLAAKQGGAREREQLIEAFRPSILGVARMYRNCSRVEWNELLQEGVVGLLRALERYDVELGIPFWAYATWWVRQAMQQAVSELSRPLVLSDRALRQLARVKKAQRALEQSQGRTATCQDLAQAVGLPRHQVESLICIDRVARSLDEPGAGDAGDAATPAEQLPDPPAEDEYERADWRLLMGELPRLLQVLGERERSVIRSRYGIGRPERTLREIGEVLGV
ncbi:MAG TPA: sigma-70 family RNA polymerase sigma factor, partial [Solirubrobacteraceae bacterium]